MNESIKLQAVAPVKPVAPYIGGKRALAKRLVALINQTPHETYAEPFVGMGGVFFRRDQRPRKEVINDISRDVVTLFRLLQRHYQQLLDVLKWQICSRSEFERLMKTDPATLTDLERAARFIYLQRTAFGGKVKGRNFGVTMSGSARFDLTKLVPMLEDVHERLSGVDIECLPYADLIERYDRPGTLFYLDPPYFKCENDYGLGVFERADFERIATQLAGIKGRFILSINDAPEIREIFSAFKCEPVGLKYTVGTTVSDARELIITN